MNYLRRIQKIGKLDNAELRTTVGYIKCIENREIQKKSSFIQRNESDRVGTYFGTMQFSNKFKKGYSLNAGIEL